MSRVEITDEASLRRAYELWKNYSYKAEVSEDVDEILYASGMALDIERAIFEFEYTIDNNDSYVKRTDL